MRIYSLLFAVALVACSDDFKGDGNDLVGSDGGDGTDGGEDPNDVDDDGDGFTENQGDCDDSNSTMYPGAEEFCNNADDDCDGEIDDPDDLADGQGYLKYEDADGDGYGNPYVDNIACEFSEGWVDDNTDCDDEHATAYPGGSEVNWNNIDENCDGEDFDLDGCLARAMEATEAELNEGSPWAMPDFYNTYDLTVNVPLVGTQTLSGAGYGQVLNQLAFITARDATIVADGSYYEVYFETNLGYNAAAQPFTLEVGVSPSYWNFGFGGYTVGGIITGAIELVTDVPDDFDGSVQCLGYVNPLSSDFDGTVALMVSESTRTVSADAVLESNITDLTEGDAVLEGPGGGICGNEIIDVIAGYIGIGSTWTFLNQNLEQVGGRLVNTYETSLEANIEAECSGR